jgi:hypothetical protein
LQALQASQALLLLHPLATLLLLLLLSVMKALLRKTGEETWRWTAKVGTKGACSVVGGHCRTGKGAWLGIVVDVWRKRITKAAVGRGRVTTRLEILVGGVALRREAASGWSGV